GPPDARSAGRAPRARRPRPLHRAPPRRARAPRRRRRADAHLDLRGIPERPPRGGGDGRGRDRERRRRLSRARPVAGDGTPRPGPCAGGGRGGAPPRAARRVARAPPRARRAAPRRGRVRRRADGGTDERGVSGSAPRPRRPAKRRSGVSAGARMRIAYVIPVYPPVPSQPFVVNEMVEVQDAGHEVFLLPLYPAPPSPVRHGTFERFRPEAVFAPAICNGRICWQAVRTAVARPLRVLTTLAGIHRAAGGNFYAQARLLAITPKALAAAGWLRRNEIGRIHAHFANQTADCAAIAGRVADVPFSFTAH